MTKKALKVFSGPYFRDNTVLESFHPITKKKSIKNFLCQALVQFLQQMPLKL
jgi:hypothetical protein